MPERDSAGLREIAALVRVGKRLLGASVQLAPGCCPLQVHGEQLRMATLELRSEEITEQVVVAEPLAAIVERDDERIRAREGLERIRGVVRAKHRIAQGWGHPVEDRRTKQEHLEIARLARQSPLPGDSRRSAAECRSVRQPSIAASSRSLNDSAASATAAAHPSVRSRRASAACSDSSRPPRAATARVSSASSARSAAPTSTRSPPARRRPSRTPGSPRPTNTN